MPTSDKPRLLAFSGSLRKASINSAVLRDMADMTIFPLHDVPLYNEDIDVHPLPPGVEAFRAAIGAADGVVIAPLNIITACPAC